MIDFIAPEFLTEIKLDAKCTLLKEGEVAKKMFFIKKGCLRVWFNNNGQDITTQIFLEGEAATSLESFVNNEPSPFSIETLEPCDIAVITQADFETLIKSNPGFKDWFYETALQKLLAHSKRLLSFVKNKPQQRYQELLEQQPHLFQRVPQRYIASYLGITTVSLSRIRNRK